MKRSKVISLIGRPNVGKSSLFNALMKKASKSITFDTPGVTRDRHYGILSLQNEELEASLDSILVDTGGFYPEMVEENISDNKFFNIMREHAHIAIKESDLVLMVVDSREGILPFDMAIADYLRTQNTPFWVLVNKFDSDKQSGEEVDFYSLGVNDDELFTTSAAHNRGIELLREHLFKWIQEDLSEGKNLQKGVVPREDVISKVAIIGAPNSGKSTLLNQLVGSSRALVSPVAGTTVDPIEGYFDLYFGQNALEMEEKSPSKGHTTVLHEEYKKFRQNHPDLFHQFENEDEDSENIKGSFWRSIHIIDTAGIRKKGHIQDTIETQSVFRSLRCISESDIVIYMVDAVKGVGHQDRRLIDVALSKGKSLIICLNKFDLVKLNLKDQREQKEWYLDIRDKLPWIEYCDILPLSAKTGANLKSLKNSLKKTILVRHKVIPTGQLNRVIAELVDKNPVIPSAAKGTRLKVKYTSMIKSSPPTFILFTNKSKGIPENYTRYLKNALRKEFQLYNSPVHLIFRSGKDLEERRK